MSSFGLSSARAEASRRNGAGDTLLALAPGPVGGDAA